MQTTDIRCKKSVLGVAMFTLAIGEQRSVCVSDINIATWKEIDGGRRSSQTFVC